MRLRFVLLLSILMFWAAPASAQPVPIYQHPQLDAYASAADCPAIDSQAWMGNPNPILASHVHVVLQACIYQKVLSSAPFDVLFTLKLHDIDGVLTELSGPQIKSIKWDATGTSEMPVMRCPNPGLCQWTGVATIDPTLLVPGDFLHIFDFAVHGWQGLRFFTRTYLDTGRYADVISTVPVYSLIDPSAPEHQSPQQGNPGVTLRTSFTLWDPNEGAIVGEVITEIDDYIPLLSISAPWTTIANLYNYTAPTTLVGDNRFELHKDADLHHGIVGGLQRSEPAQTNRSFFGPITLDPTDLGSGDHKEMASWLQVRGAENFSSVIVFPLSVGAGVPPPPPPTLVTVPNLAGLPQAQAVTNIVAANLTLGSVTLLSATTVPAGDVVSQMPAAGSQANQGSTVSLVVSSQVPPPPVDVWQAVNPIIQTLGTTGRYRICNADQSVCKEFVFQ